MQRAKNFARNLKKRFRGNKNLVSNFINGFKNDKLYFRLEDVKKAKSFLLANPGESQADIENTFQEKFIDNFIEGESVFFISH